MQQKIGGATVDAFKKLRQVFPDTDEETTLIFLGPSTRLRIGNKPIQLAAYPLGDGRFVYAAYSTERNQIYVRLDDFPGS